MATLTRLIQTRAVYERFAGGTGLEKGIVFSFTPCATNNSVPFPCTQASVLGSNFCFQSPGYGTAIIESWGAGGSGTMAGCCSFSIPGNAGAYARKTVCMEYCGYVCGCVGHSCGANNAACAGCFICRACSCPVALCWHSGRPGCDGCICAMGGRAGFTLCGNASCSGYCMFLACNMCGSQPAGISGVGCGLICNYINCTTAGSSCGANGPLGNDMNPCRWMACAYGGDVNCCGGFSCALFLHCNSCCHCCRINYVTLPWNMWSEKQSQVEVRMNGTDGDRFSGYWGPWWGSTAGLTRSPTGAYPTLYCFTGAAMCGCYEMQTCISYIGPGVPGIGGIGCASVNFCDYGMRGGSGGVRITWIAADNEPFRYDTSRFQDQDGS